VKNKKKVQRTTIVVDETTMARVKQLAKLMHCKQTEIWALLVDKYYAELTRQIMRENNMILHMREKLFKQIETILNILEK
jgi:hypothetical protein